MVTVTGLTAERMRDIEAASVVDGDIVGDNLILTKHDGSTINAGNVRGPAGSDGISAPTPKLFKAFSSWTTPIPTSVVTTVTGWSHTASTSSPSVSGMFTIDTDGDFHVNEAGLYTITFTASFPSNTVGRRIAFLYKNGADQRRQDVASAGFCTVEVVDPQILVVGDVLQFRVYQSSGASLTPGAAPDQHVTFLKHG